MEDNTVSGILINDICYHLPVFVVYDSNYKNDKDANNYNYKQVRTEESINALRSELLQNWKIIYEDIDKAYLKRCPIKQYSRD